MRKTKVLKLFSLLLCCCVLVQAFAAGANMTETGNIPEDLQAAMDAAGEDDLITVYFWYPLDEDVETLEAMTEAELGFAKGEIVAVADEAIARNYQEWMDKAEQLRQEGAPEEEINACIEQANSIGESDMQMKITDLWLSTYRRIGRELHENASAALIAQMGLAEDRIVTNSKYAPMMILKLTKAEIAAFAAENLGVFSLYEELEMKPTSLDSLIGNSDENMLMMANFDAYRPVWGFTYQNPAYISGVGTVVAYAGDYEAETRKIERLETPRFCNLIGNDYYNVHKDELLLKAYNEYLEKYETWRDTEVTVETFPLASRLCILAHQKLYSSDGTFKAFWEDYGNPEKTVYLEIMLKDAAAAAEITADEAVTLIYDTEACPCIVVRFTGDEAVFQRILDNPDVLFAAPALGAAIDPGYTYMEMRTPYEKYNTGGVTAASARNILRYSVGLDVSEDLKFHDGYYTVNEREFFTYSDLNFDGHVTAADARLALRIAVGLDKLPVVGDDILYYTPEKLYG